MSVLKEGIEGVVRGVGGVADDLFTSDEERGELALRRENQRLQHQVAIMQASLSAIIAEAGSTDKLTSRARPMFLYVMYTLFLLIMLGAIVGIWYPDEMRQASENLSLLFNALPDELYALFGAGYLGYTGARTYDKKQKVKYKNPPKPQYPPYKPTHYYGADYGFTGVGNL